MLLHRPSASTLATLAVTALPLPLHVIGAHGDGHALATASERSTTASTPAATTTPAPTTASTPSATTSTPAAPGSSTPSGARPHRSAAGRSLSWRRQATNRAGTRRHDLVLSVSGPGARRRAHAAGDPGDTISDFKFSPATITIHVGDTITWTNDGPTEHSATASNGSFNTGLLQKGASASHTFTQAGTFAYICSIHPFMHGTVVVEAATTTSTPSGTSSGSSGSAGSTGSSSASTPTATTTSTAPSLPNTGTNLITMLLVGALLIGAGLGLRRYWLGRNPGF